MSVATYKPSTSASTFTMSAATSPAPTSTFKTETSINLNPTEMSFLTELPSTDESVLGGCHDDVCLCPVQKKKCTASISFQNICKKFHGPDCEFPCDLT